MWARNNIYHIREQKHNSFNTKIQKTMITLPPPWPQFQWHFSHNFKCNFTMAFQSIRYFHTHHLLRFPPNKVGGGGGRHRRSRYPCCTTEENRFWWHTKMPKGAGPGTPHALPPSAPSTIPAFSFQCDSSGVCPPVHPSGHRPGSGLCISCSYT